MSKGKKQEFAIRNKKAYHDYTIGERYEAGIVLKGAEVKSIRGAKANFNDAYIRFSGEEAFIHNMHISPYENAPDKDYVTTRPRKLLLHKEEIHKIMGHTQQKGYTVIPLKAYFKRGRVKIEIAECCGKRKYDKRESLKRKTAQREVEQAMKHR